MAKKVNKVIDLYELGKAAQSLLLRHHGGLLPDTRHYDGVGRSEEGVSERGSFVDGSNACFIEEAEGG